MVPLFHTPTPTESCLVSSLATPTPPGACLVPSLCTPTLVEACCCPHIHNGFNGAKCWLHCLVESLHLHPSLSARIVFTSHRTRTPCRRRSLFITHPSAGALSLTLTSSHVLSLCTPPTPPDTCSVLGALTLYFEPCLSSFSESSSAF